MRFIVIGAGAVGGTVGARLALSGEDVLLMDLPGPTKLIRERGLRYASPQGTDVLRLPIVSDASEIQFREDDVVLLCVKSQHTQDALDELRAVTTDVPIFCLQNGVRNEETAARYFDRVYGVMVRGSAVCLADGEVMSTMEPAGVFVIGRYPAGMDDLAKRVATALAAADYTVRVVPDVMRYKWSKLIRNIRNGVEAIAGSRAETVEITKAAREEACAILDQAGVDWLPQERLEEQWGGLQRPLRQQLHVHALGSTWQSLMRREGTVETEYLNGEIVRLAEQIGREAPINRTLTRIAAEMADRRDVPGRYTPANLSALLGLVDRD